MHFLVHVVYYSARCKTYKKRGFLEIGTSTKSKFLHKGKETKHDIVTLHKPVVTTAFCVQDRKRIPVLSRFCEILLHACCHYKDAFTFIVVFSFHTVTKSLNKLVSTVTCHVSIVCIVEWLSHQSSGEDESVTTRSCLVLEVTKVKLGLNRNFVRSRNDT